MVHCAECEQVLPVHCICDKTREAKIADFLDKAQRELTIIKLYYESGYLPKVRIHLYNDGESAPLKTIFPKVRGEQIKLGVKLKMEQTVDVAADRLVAVLYDVNGALLYRQTYHVHASPGDLLVVNWSLVGFSPDDKGGGVKSGLKRIWRRLAL